MRRLLAEHIGSILAVGFVFGLLAIAIRDHEATVLQERRASVGPYLSMKFMDFGNPLHRALFRETLSAFRPDSSSANDALVRSIDEYRDAEFTNPSLKVGAPPRGLSWSVLRMIAPMYFSFLLACTLALLCTLYAARTIALYRFVAVKQGRESLLRLLYGHLRSREEPRWRGRSLAFLARAALLLAGAAVKGIAMVVLFAPAYVIGYALKTQFETGGVAYMILLGVISNGLLIMYANRFYTLLVSESRKGYVETAVAKGLSRVWRWNRPGGVPLASLFRIRKHFPSHVLGHIYLNARYQYIPSTKEQASFMITGLIIAEMALNIQGHLGYELMQKILDHQYDVVLAIAFGIFVIVKLTDMLVDAQWLRESRTYENR